MDFSQLLNQVLGAAQKGGKAVADSPLNSFGGGALTGALASMLLKKKNTKKLVKAGSVAALGFLAYKGYQNWKQNRQQDELPQSAFQPAGLIDDAERAAIERESGSDAETAAWLQAEYAQPASIEQIAASVGNDEALAAETYLAARLVCADLSRKEIVFLSRLSQALNLDDQLVESLEKQLELA
ncbi:TPA: tellurite resistance TerB family protein [Neisseria subflava]